MLEKSNKIKKGVVYTCITGNYDYLFNHTFINSEWDYVCFTDCLSIRGVENSSWLIKPLVFDKLDNARNQRWHKLHPHRLFPEYQRSIWVDGNIDILSASFFNDVQKIIERKKVLSLFRHNLRDCLYDELKACIEKRKDDFETMKKQVEEIRKTGFPSHYGLFETGLIYREHFDPLVIKVMEEWWWWVENYSKRDQLSLTYVLWNNNLRASSLSDVSIAKQTNVIRVWPHLNKMRELVLGLEEQLENSKCIKEELFAIKVSLRWKIANYFYNFLKKFFKKIDNPFFKKMMKKNNWIKRFFGLILLIWKEFKNSGLKGLIFAIKRHFGKKRGKILTSYSQVSDYHKGLVTIAILTKNRLDLIKPCIESIENNLSKKYSVEILIGDTGSNEKAVWQFYKFAKIKYKNIKVIRFKNYFFSKNYNDLINFSAKGEFLILLNNDTVVQGNWIDEMVDLLQDKKVGIVGGKLLYRDGTIQHAGLEFKDQNAVHIFKKRKKDFKSANVLSVVPAVTFACVGLRHDVFDRFKLSEDFVHESQDVDFCLRLRRAGFDVVYNPKVEIYHFECSTRDWRKGDKDRALLWERWNTEIKQISSSCQRKVFNPNFYQDAIVVIRDDGIGDLLMGVSAFKTLREQNPSKKLILLTYRRNIKMMEGFGIFDEILPIPDNQKYAPLPLPSKGTKIYNFIDMEMKFGPIYGKAKKENKTHRHLIYSQSFFGKEVKYQKVKMPDFLWEREKVEKMLKEKGVFPKKNKIVILNLLASNPARSWWEKYYPQLIDAIERMNFIPIVIGNKESDFFIGEKVVDLTGTTKTITEYIELLKFGDYVISADTSAYHIAALSGIPFLVIFSGGVKAEARLKFYDKYEAIEPPPSLKCFPCWDEGCKDLAIRWRKEPCRILIKPEEVIEKFKRLVKKYPV